MNISRSCMFMGLVTFIVGMSFGVFDESGRLSKVTMAASCAEMMFGYVYGLYRKSL